MEGQRVRKGDLGGDRPEPYQAAVEQAEGQLVKDEANAVNAQAEAARYKALFQAGVVSKESRRPRYRPRDRPQGAIDAERPRFRRRK